MTTEIHDLGYRAYDGERAGIPWAIRSLAVHSMRRALGLKRAGKHKIAPVITIILAYLPAMGLAAAAAFLGSEIVGDLISYGEYFGITNFALLLFTAAAAPGVLTTDRTSGMLALYLASPLTRTTYVLAKALGLFAVMLIVTAGPIVFLVLAYTLAGAGPDGFFAFVEILARALVAGALAGLLYTGLGIFISSLPRRWSIASVSIFATVLVTNIVTAVLTEEAEATSWLALGAPVLVMGEAWQRVLDSPVLDDLRAFDDRSSFIVILVAFGYAVAFLAASWWRYQTVDVER